MQQVLLFNSQVHRRTSILSFASSCTCSPKSICVSVRYRLLSCVPFLVTTAVITFSGLACTFDEMGSGGIVDKWLVELAIRTAKDDKVVAKTLSLVPRLRDDVGLKKIVLLRGIESEMDEGSVSERMLDALEVAFELDRRQGLDVLESMKAAYCAVAVDCVARFVKSVGGGDVYLKAVKRVWRRRIGPLIAHDVDLVSEQLETWRDTVESAIWDDNVRDKLFVTNTRYEALVAIKGYLDEAWKIVGPSLLELLASSELGKSFVKAQQQLCLPSISEPSEGEPQRPFDMPAIFNHNAQVLSDPSNLVSSNDQEDVAKILTQNLGDNSKSPADINHKEVSEASFCAHTVNRHLDENMRLADCGIAEEKNLLQSSSGLARDQSDNVELVHVKSKVAEDATLPLPGVCATNSFVYDDHLKGAGTDFVNESKANLRSSPAQGNLQSLNNSKAHYKDTRKLRVRSKHVGRPNKRPKPVRVNNSEDWDLEGLDTQYHPLPETEVIKVREELKSSSRELQAAVKDPLPDALRVAEAVISDVSRNCIPQGAPAASITDRETPNFQDAEVDRGRDKASTSHSAEVRTSNTEGNTMNLRTNKSYERDPRDAAGNASPPETMGDGDNNVQNEGSRHGNRQQRANLWERDASARTYEWDDSIDGSQEENYGLPTPKTHVNPPRKNNGSVKYARRRHIKRWSLLEEDTLRAGVQRFGKGNWKMILVTYRDIFEERTDVDLKDKWRRMMK